MAGDSVGVLDHLGIEQAHIVGASMGGMIAQTIAIRYPQRVLSLVSIMSNTGSVWTGQPALTMYAVLLKPAPREREAFIQHAVDMFTKIGGTGYAPDVEDLRDIATPQLRARRNPAGSLRQLHAIVADRDRTPQLRRLRVPDDGHPRRRRPARAPLRRPRDGEGHPGRAAGDDPRHGPRPAARRLAADRRRDRRERRARRRRLRQREDEHDDDRAAPGRAPPMASGCHWFAQKPGFARSRV